MGNVGEWSAMDEGRGMLKGLNQIRLQCILKQGSHGSLSLQVTGCYRLIVIGISDDYSCQSALEVRNVRCQTQNGHYFGSYRYVKAILTRCAVTSGTQTVYDVS